MGHANSTAALPCRLETLLETRDATRDATRSPDEAHDTAVVPPILVAAVGRMRIRSLAATWEAGHADTEPLARS